MNPRDCPYAHDPDADAWICPQCDDAKIARYDERGNRKPAPRRNCPAAPGWEVGLRRHLMERLTEKADASLIDLVESTWDRRIDVCLDGCPYFVGRGCTRWGRACSAVEKWIDRLGGIDGKTCDRWG